MNPFLLSPQERLAHWKEFRKSLTQMSETSQLQSVAEYWTHAPIKTIAYDPNNAASWLTPWEMMHANEWCRSSLAIGMESTLRLSGFSSERLKLKLILDRDVQEMLLILTVDLQWVLNYSWGNVVPYPKTNHSVLKEWHFVGKNYISLG